MVKINYTHITHIYMCRILYSYTCYGTRIYIMRGLPVYIHHKLFIIEFSAPQFFRTITISTCVQVYTLYDSVGILMNINDFFQREIVS